MIGLRMLSLFLGVATVCAPTALLYATTLTFEDLPASYFFSSGGQNIGSYYSGVNFGPYVTGLSVTRFGGYADAAYPPHSGDVVIFSAFDTDITISFASALSNVSFWYTSFDPVSLLAYDSANVLLGSVTGAPNTDGFTGASSFLSLSAGGIASVTISSTPGLFVLDDLTYQPAVAVAEPGGLLLLAAACWFVRRRRRTRWET